MFAKSCFFYTLLILFVVLEKSFSQDTVRVIPSTQKVMIGGKPFYLHLIKKGETLYSICKAYNIEQKNLAMENPAVFEGLKVGETLKIPVASVRAVTPKKQEEFINHKVIKGETLYSLSKKYKIDIREIIKWNPQAEKGVKIGETLHIPKAEQESDFEKQTFLMDDKFEYHEVKEKETIYSIAKKYKVTPEEIKKFNPDIKDKALELDYILKIPKLPKKEIKKETKKPDTVTVKKMKTPVDTVFSADSSSVRIAVDCGHFNYKTFSKPYEVALMLPLFLKENSELTIDEVVSETKKIQPNDKFLEFYEGALLALDSLKKTGLSVNLYVFDTGNDTNKVSQIAAMPKIKTFDLIIGPAYPENLNIISEKALASEIPLVSPLSSKDECIEKNPLFLRINPSLYSQLKLFCQSLTEYYDKNIVFIYNETPEETELLKLYKKLLKESLLAKTDSTHIYLKTVSYKTKGVAGIKEALSDKTENLIIIPSFDRPFVSNMISKLNTLYKDFPMTLAGFPIWEKYENIEMECFYHLKYHTYSTFYIDYQDREVKNFIKKYREFYFTEPSEYSFKGYDILFFFLNAMQHYGPDFVPCLASCKTGLMHSEFNFLRMTETSGFENDFIYIFKYTDDYNILNVTENKKLFRDIIIKTR